MSFRTGQVIDGRYCLIVPLGVGGMAEVWKANDLQLSTESNPIPRAIKFLRPDLVEEAYRTMDGTAYQPKGASLLIERFLREHRAAASLQHEYIVPIYDVGVDREFGIPYYVMDIVDGPPLESIINQYAARVGLPPPGTLGAPQHQLSSSVVPMEMVYRLLDQFCAVLAYVHRQGVIHRDLKPQNTLIVYDLRGLSQIRIIDFGIAKFLETALPRVNDHKQLTLDGLVTGTPYYMAPEAFLGSMEDEEKRKWRIGPYTDIYSIGMIGYEMLTGHLPYSDDDFGVLLKRFVDPTSTAPDPSQYVSDLSPLLWRVIKKMLAPRPWERFQNAEDARNALREAEILDRARMGPATFSGRPPDPVSFAYSATVSSEPPAPGSFPVAAPLPAVAPPPAPAAPAPAVAPLLYPEDEKTPVRLAPTPKGARKGGGRVVLLSLGAVLMLAGFLLTVSVLRPSPKPPSTGIVQEKPAVASVESKPEVQAVVREAKPATPPKVLPTGKRIPETPSRQAAELLKNGDMMANGPVKDCKHALVLYRQAAEQSPNAPETHKAIAHCESRLGHVAEARAAALTYNSFLGVTPLMIP
jgi:eukaryotic-like serine/threonine-protein kinase